MLFRLKIKIDALVTEILDQLPKEVFESRTTTFFDPAMAGGQFVVQIEKRLRACGHSDENIATRVYGLAEDIIDLNYAINTKKLIGRYAVGGLEEMEQCNMKFDVIVGNPPYQGINYSHAKVVPTTLYIDFVEKALLLSDKVLMIIPSTWLFKPSAFRKILLTPSTNTIGLLDPAIFNVGMSICYFDYDANKNNEYCRVIDSSGEEVNVKLTTDMIFSKKARGFLLLRKIKNQGMKKLSHRWCRGLAVRTTQTNLSAVDPVQCVLSIKDEVSDAEIVTISASKDNPGKGYFKVGMSSIHGDLTSVGNLKIFNKNHVCGKSVVFLTTSSMIESNTLLAYLKSKIVKFIISHNKASAANSKNLFDAIPDIDLTRTWTDAELYAHFNLTQEEIDYIEANVK